MKCLADDAYSDPAVKQIILHMNEQNPIIIQDLDDTHVLIQPAALENLREALDLEVCNHTLLVLC